MAMDRKTRKAAVAFLTHNCDCWRGDKGAAALNALTDDQLEAVAVGYNNGKALELTANAIGFDGVYNEMPEFVKAKMHGKDEEEDEMMEDDEDDEDAEGDRTYNAYTPPPGRTPAPTKPRQLSERDWMAMAPPSIRSAVVNAQKAELKEKQEIVKKLVANCADPDKRKSKAKLLINKSVDELNELLELVPPPAPRQSKGDGDSLDFLFQAAAVAPLGNVGTARPEDAPGDDATLDIPTLNYEEVAEQRRSQGRRTA